MSQAALEARVEELAKRLSDLEGKVTGLRSVKDMQPAAGAVVCAEADPPMQFKIAPDGKWYQVPEEVTPPAEPKEPSAPLVTKPKEQVLPGSRV